MFYKPRNSRLPYISRHSLFKRREHEFEASVLTLCFKPCAVCDNLSLFAQSTGCPKRLIKTEPNQLSLKRLLRLKTFMHTHTHAYFCDNRGRIVLGHGQMSRQSWRQKLTKVRRRPGHDLPRIVCFLLSGTYGQIQVEDRVTTDRSSSLPGAGQAENIAAR